MSFIERFRCILPVTGFIRHMYVCTFPAGMHCCDGSDLKVFLCLSLQVNPEIVPELEKHGLRFVGQDETQKRMEIMELPGEGGMG